MDDKEKKYGALTQEDIDEAMKDPDIKAMNERNQAQFDRDKEWLKQNGWDGKTNEQRAHEQGYTSEQDYKDAIGYNNFVENTNSYIGGDNMSEIDNKDYKERQRELKKQEKENRKNDPEWKAKHENKMKRLPWILLITFMSLIVLITLILLGVAFYEAGTDYEIAGWVFTASSFIIGVVTGVWGKKIIAKATGKEGKKDGKKPSKPSINDPSNFSR